MNSSFSAIKIVMAAWTCGLLASSGAAETINAVLTSPPTRSQASSFSLIDAAGATQHLSDYLGKVVVLNFWATDCAGCRLEIPWLVHIAQAFRNKNAVVVGVSMDISYEELKGPEEAWAKVKPFVASHQIAYPIPMGTDEAAKAYHIEALPVTVLIDTRGRAAATYVGLINEDNVRSNIDTLLAESSGHR